MATVVDIDSPVSWHAWAEDVITAIVEAAQLSQVGRNRRRAVVAMSPSMSEGRRDHATTHPCRLGCRSMAERRA